MNEFIVIVHDWRENEHYPLGVFSTQAKAMENIDGYMAAEYGFSEYTDWELNPISGNYQYYYEGFTVEVQEAILDDAVF